MLLENNAKTKLARRLPLVLIVAFIFLLCFFSVLLLTTRIQSGQNLETKQTCVIEVDTECIELEYVVTAKDKETGLAKYDSMTSTQGMVFVYDVPGKACMWMKGMNFSIDIVWLDNDKRVINTATNVSPDTYPRSFCSTQPAQYVIELAAGVADQAKLKPGQQIDL